MKQNKSTINQL